MTFGETIQILALRREAESRDVVRKTHAFLPSPMA